MSVNGAGEVVVGGTAEKLTAVWVTAKIQATNPDLPPVIGGSTSRVDGTAAGVDNGSAGRDTGRSRTPALLATG